MKLERLRITQLPGIDEAFTLTEVGSGINLVTGPNASGKSSLVRALRYLIEEESVCSEGALALEADLRSENSLWRVSRSGGQVVWLRDGQPAEKPLFPAGCFLHCYWLSMHDLLEEGATEKEIMGHLQRALAGGYDLPALRKAEVFNFSERVAKKDAENYEKLESEFRKVLNEYADLERQREELSGLEAKIKHAQFANERAGRVERALELREARRQRLEAESELTGFPEAMQSLRGDELDNLTKLEKKLEELSEKRKKSQYTLEQALREKRETALGDQPPSSAELEAGKLDLNQVRYFQERLDNLRKDLRAARETEQEIASKLGTPAGEVPSVTPDKAQRAVSLAEEWWKWREKLSSLRDVSGEEEVSRERLGEIEEMIKELRRWLRQTAPSTGRSLAIGGASAAVLVTAALLSAVIGGAWPAVAFSFLAMAPIMWTLWKLNLMRLSRRESEQRAARLNIPLPENWHPATVEKKLEQLEKEAVDLREKQRRAANDEYLRQEKESVEKELENKEKEKEKLAREIGLAPGSGFETVAQFHQLADGLNQTRKDIISLEAAVQEEEIRVNYKMKNVAELLERYQLCPSQEEGFSMNRADAGLQQLRKMADKFETADNNCAQAETELGKLAEEIAEVENAEKEIYQKVGLQPGERNTLVKLCEEFPQYSEIRRRKDDAENLERDKQRRLDQEDTELWRLVELDDMAGLENLRDNLKKEASRLSEFHEHKADIQQRLNQAGRDRQLEKKRMRRDQARGRMIDLFEQTMFAEAGRFLLDEIEEEHRASREPAVIAAARERFERYTDNQYSLQLDGQGGLKAFDTRRQLAQRAETLSSGTRMQLFMALRLAWTGILEENGESLPVFLDETLTTADPERFNNIARNLWDTARKEGRQIFYLSAQPADIRRWERAVGEPPNHIHLPWLRFKEAGGEPEDYFVESFEEVPAPNGMDASEYAARLGVPAPDPSASIGSLHIFHLLRDDLSLLHKLINDWRIVHLGPLEKLLNSNAAEQVVAERDKRRLLNRCRIARLWAELWRLGRGRPVDRHALESSEAVSGKFLDDVDALARQLNGDAETLLVKLKEGAVPRFRHRKVEELADWLAANEYLDEREILSTEQRREQLLLKAGEFAPPKEIHAMILYLEGEAAGDS